MSKKCYWIIVDCETTISDTVADFGAIVVDRHGNVAAECGVLIKGEFDTKELFHNKEARDIWGMEGLKRRTDNYVKMLEEGSRMLASVSAVNRWLEKVAAKYMPELTAYNLNFDLDKCRRTSIDLSLFDKRFCLWHASASNFANAKAYKNFALSNKRLTEKQNIRTDCETMAGYVTGNLLDEPHTAIEDCKGFEKPILMALLKKRKWREKVTPYNWRDWQAKDNFTAV